MHCHTALTKTRDEIEDHFDTPFYTPEFYQPCYSNNGEQDYLYIIPQKRADLIFPAAWGLVPDFELNSSVNKQQTGRLSARSEEVFANRIFKKSIQSQRCLVLADGFFVPHFTGDRSQPYFCFLPGGSRVEERELFCYAGIYTSNGEGDYYVSLLTTKANEFFAAVQNNSERVPLVLDRGLEREWLMGLNEKKVKELMQDGFTADPFDAFPVSEVLYKEEYDPNTPEILKPVPPLDSDLLF